MYNILQRIMFYYYLTCDNFCNIIICDFAGVVQWQNIGFPSRLRGFDSLHLLQTNKKKSLWTFLFVYNEIEPCGSVKLLRNDIAIAMILSEVLSESDEVIFKQN